MTMHRLLVSTATLLDDRAELPPEAARHLKVLRPRSGEELELFDGRGRSRVYAWRPEGIFAAGTVREFAPPRTKLTLFACVTKGSRWDWTIEKAVELGVGRIVPVLSDRSIVRIPAAERPSKAERWRRIAEDAARQSHAVWLPEVLPGVDFPQALELVKECAGVFTGALTDPPPPPMAAAVTQRLAADRAESEWGVFTGPEGDFTPEELSALLAVSTPVSLGPTVLRAETAAIFGLSVLSAMLNG